MDGRGALRLDFGARPRLIIIFAVKEAQVLKKNAVFCSYKNM